MKTLRFDPDLVHTEMDAVVAWCELHGLVAKDIPTNALVTIDGQQLTVEHYVRNANGGMVLNADQTEVQRTSRTVPLVDAPAFASLKPVEPSGGTS